MNDNKGYLPAPAPYTQQVPDDWICFYPSLNLNQSAVAQYLSGGTVDPAIFRCPSDDVSYRARINFYGTYQYSYVVNSFMSYRDPITGILHGIPLVSVKSSSEKALLYEEDSSTIDDGFGTAEPDGGVNLLAVRHDPSAKLDNPGDPYGSLILNGGARGNAAFCDGHAEYIARSVLHSYATLDPNQ